MIYLQYKQELAFSKIWTESEIIRNEMKTLIP